MAYRLPSALQKTHQEEAINHIERNHWVQFCPGFQIRPFNTSSRAADRARLAHGSHHSENGTRNVTSFQDLFLKPYYVSQENWEYRKWNSYKVKLHSPKFLWLWSMPMTDVLNLLPLCPQCSAEERPRRAGSWHHQHCHLSHLININARNVFFFLSHEAI